MIKPYLKIKIDNYCDIRKVWAMITKNNPSVVVLESKIPSMNNRVIRYAQTLTKNGWDKIGYKTITKCRRTRYGTQELYTISIMLKRLSDEAGAEGIKRSEPKGNELENKR